eukprot:COSAG01_NODE_50068_length_366_cov_2.329588_1_plen_25_part_01
MPLQHIICMRVREICYVGSMLWMRL